MLANVLILNINNGGVLFVRDSPVVVMAVLAVEVPEADQIADGFAALATRHAFGGLRFARFVGTFEPHDRFLTIGQNGVVQRIGDRSIEGVQTRTIEREEQEDRRVQRRQLKIRQTEARH